MELRAINRVLQKDTDSESGLEWMSVSDMMTGLMVIFLFIAISYMIHIQDENARMLQVAETYTELHAELYQDLLQEFKDDLPRWSAHIDSSSLAVRFTEPDVLFTAGSSKIREGFQEILDDFFPRYISILRRHKYRDDIEEIRIEGHTSSEWQDLPPEQAYFYNMDLSQTRTRAVLQYVIGLDDFISSEKKWLRSLLTANGLSSSRLIMQNGVEDKIRSRRVEFRVRTNAEARITEIIGIGS